MKSVQNVGKIGFFIFLMWKSVKVLSCNRLVNPWSFNSTSKVMLWCLVASGGLEIWVSWASFQTSNISWPQQPPIGKVLKFNIVASLILCSTISSSYSSLDPLCYDHQLTGLYLVRQLTINSLLIRQYIQSITSTQPCKISSLTEVTLTHLVNISSLRRSADVPTPFHRLATMPM